MRKIARKQCLEIARQQLKSDPIVKELLEKYQQPASILDEIKVSFVDNLSSSAETVNGEIHLNSAMKDDLDEIKEYFVHELTHCLQHISGKCGDAKDKDAPYLEKESELEAFRAQIRYLLQHEGVKKAFEYIKVLFAHHKLKRPERVSVLKELFNRNK